MAYLFLNFTKFICKIFENKDMIYVQYLNNLYIYNYGNWFCGVSVREKWGLADASYLIKKNIDPSQSYRWSKFGAHVQFYCMRDFQSWFPENDNFSRPLPLWPEGKDEYLWCGKKQLEDLTLHCRKHQQSIFMIGQL